MGKEGQLWDDSALITAFDLAISNYKKMHGKGYNCNLTPDNSTDTPLDVFSNTDVSEEEEVEVGVVGNLETVNEEEVTEQQSFKERALESNSLAHQDQSQNYTNSINSEEYSVLYKQYYELEEQRQKILQQMQQFSNEYYPYSGEASTAGEYQVTSQTPCVGTMVVSCCPCPCQCSVASCSSLTCPNVGTHVDAPSTTKDIEIKPMVDNGDLVAEALGAAERALSSLKNKTFDSEKGNVLCNGIEQNTDSETELSTVLNAWYSAGFYTGKYLSEKSMAKKRHD